MAHESLPWAGVSQATATLPGLFAKEILYRRPWDERLEISSGTYITCVYHLILLLVLIVVRCLQLPLDQ